VALVFEVPEEHHVYWHPVFVDQVFDDPLSGDVDRGGDDGEPVAGIQPL
jgi:hypothetical protein